MVKLTRPVPPAPAAQWETNLRYLGYACHVQDDCLIVEDPVFVLGRGGFVSNTVTLRTADDVVKFISQRS